MLCLVIGFGSIGKRHTEVLEGFSKVSAVHVVSKQKLKRPNHYSTISAAIAENQYDYIVVASPTAMHEKDLKTLYRAKVNSIIMVEKPLFHTYIKTTTLSQKTYVGYNLRFHPLIRKLQELIEKAGEVYYAAFSVGQYLPNWRPGRDYTQTYSAKRKDGGGVLLDLSHEIDLLHMLFGKIRKLTGLRTKRSSLKIDSEDISIFTGITKRNTIFSINMDYLAYQPTRTITVQTSVCTIRADLLKNFMQVTMKNGSELSQRLRQTDRNHTYKAMHKAALESDFTNLCSMHDGLQINYWIKQLDKTSILRRVI